MIPDHDPVLARRLKQADQLREALLRHSAFRGAKIERWYNEHDKAHSLWLDVSFPVDDARETFTIEYAPGLPYSAAIDAENELVAEFIQKTGGTTLAENPITPEAVNQRAMEKRIQGLEAQNARLVAQLLALGWRPGASS